MSLDNLYGNKSLATLRLCEINYFARLVFFLVPLRLSQTSKTQNSNETIASIGIF